jgi:hypothetical protein
MKIIRRIILIFFTLFSTSIVYSQNVKQKTVSSPASAIFFGKFTSDSVNHARANEIITADSLFVKGGAGKIISFDVYTNNDSVRITESIYGNRLSKKQKLLISKIKPGQIVYLQNIMVRYTGKEKVKSNSRFAFKIRS